METTIGHGRQRRGGNCIEKMAFRCRLLVIMMGGVVSHLTLGGMPMVSGGASGVFNLRHLYADSEGSAKRNNGTGMNSQHFETLKAHDRARHRRILRTVVDFPVGGSADPYIAGLYFTRVVLGTPPQPYYVQIDTGSDILWVNCKPCNACPLTSGLGIALSLFDTQGSSTSLPLSCTDSKCADANQVSEAGCNSDHYCGYSFQYGDGSGTVGYYVSDVFHFNQVVGDLPTGNASASIIFGCSYNQSGDLTKADRAVDGIFGFGQHDLSVVSQLYSQGLSPKIFSHCLEGGDRGGGILVLGEITEPGIVYSPIVQSQPHYNLNLQSIAVNGQKLSVDPEVFTTTDTHGTIIDCGTTLAYLAEEAYEPFVDAIVAVASQSTQPFPLSGNQCFLTANRIGEVFPSVTLFFEDAALELGPEDYLIQQAASGNIPVWCIGWLKSGEQGKDNMKMTILGDLVLKNKIFVYDLQNQRIGWTNYDCSSSVNVSTASGENKSINSAKLNSSGSPVARILEKLPITLCFLLWIVSLL